MKVEVITPSADPDHGGFGCRVHSLISMLSQFAEVDVVLTDWFDGPRVPGARYRSVRVRDDLRTRVQRLRTYYRTRFPRLAASDSPDLVLVESLDLLGLAQHGPSVPVVLDEHNVYWNLLQYDLVNAPFFRGWVGRRPAVRRLLLPRLLERARQFEMQAVRDSRRTLVPSEVDRRAIVEACPDSANKVRVLPNCVDVRRVTPLPEATDSRDVVFVGDFNYVPNRDAARFITQILAPAIPGGRFLLVGAHPPEPAVPMPNVVATGRVPDLRGVLQDAAVCIAPLAHGSGTRVKILTYLSAARAVVATSKACEGLSVRDGKHLLVRDDPEAFRAAVQELLEDPARRRDLGARGRQLVEDSFDWRVYVPWMRDFCSEVCGEGRGPA